MKKFSTTAVVAILGVALAGAVAVKRPRDEVVAERNAVLERESKKFDAVSFASLAAMPTSETSVSSGKYQFTRRFVINADSLPFYSVKIVVTPVAQPNKRDSVTLDRVVADAR